MPKAPQIITTIHGEMDEADLERTLGFEDRPNEFVVWVEWRYNGELVRRDAHLILKRLSVEAAAVAAAIG